MTRIIVMTLLATTGLAHAADLPRRTSLSDTQCVYRVPQEPYFVLERNGVRAVVVNNQAVDDDVLPGHRAGYSGLAYLGHRQREENLFVPSYAGWNFEHIHDGTKQDRKVLFEPRSDPMQLRVVDAHTVELYQAPTTHYGLESCLRYRMLEDGALEMIFECIPRRRRYQHDYIGLFWASYIHQPTSLDIHFQGVESTARRRWLKPLRPAWIQGKTPSHGTLATHVGLNDQREFKHEDDFPLTLVFNRSRYRYTSPWYFGVSHGMAWVQMFRPMDQVRLTQSPSGGGKGNPAWDFQFLVENYQVGQRYQMVMRGMYIPFKSHAQVERQSATHRQALGIYVSP